MATKAFPRIYSTDSAKAAKAAGYGYLNAIHYMAPHTSGGVGNLCSHASWQCITICLGLYSGQAAMVSDLVNGTNSVRESRKNKAQLFMRNRAVYMNEMARATASVVRQARRESLTPCIRPNGSTDIPFERIRFIPDARTIKALNSLGYYPAAGIATTLLELFHWVQFVDYTKNPNRLGKAPSNLHLTLSYSGSNLADCLSALSRGHNVAVVFGEGLPDAWHGYSVIDGDKHDLRHLDPRGGFIVGLSPKGLTAKRDTSGFVVRGYAMAQAA